MEIPNKALSLAHSLSLSLAHSLSRSHSLSLTLSLALSLSRIAYRAMLYPSVAFHPLVDFGHPAGLQGMVKGSKGKLSGMTAEALYMRDR